MPLIARILLLVALASSPLYGQVATGSPTDDPTARSGNQQAQETSPQQNQSQASIQPKRLPPPPQEQNSGRATPDPQSGNIFGTVTDAKDAAVPGASVVLEGVVLSDRRAVATNDAGFFEIRDVKPGIPYHVTITANGFATWTSDVFLDPGQHKILTGIKLQIEEVQTTVTVTPETTLEIATEQVKVEVNQRGFGFIPNFFAVYVPNPAPLTAKLKFKLAFKVVSDPGTAAGIALLAGVGQAKGTPDFAGGIRGFGERFGATYANQFTDVMIGGAILPSLLHQDPRYFYQGTGTVKSRAFHAIAAIFVAKGDNGRRQVNYSSLGGDLASAAISNTYYPASNRGAGLVLHNFAVETGVHIAVRLLQEFVFPPRR